MRVLRTVTRTLGATTPELEVELKFSVPAHLPNTLRALCGDPSVIKFTDTYFEAKVLRRLLLCRRQFS
jgi:hypothetical protein